VAEVEIVTGVEIMTEEVMIGMKVPEVIQVPAAPEVDIRKDRIQKTGDRRQETEGGSILNSEF
jgi:hypothetical protein